jgi:hypothetical protein
MHVVVHALTHVHYAASSTASIPELRSTVSNQLLYSGAVGSYRSIETPSSGCNSLTPVGSSRTKAHGEPTSSICSTFEVSQVSCRVMGNSTCACHRTNMYICRHTSAGMMTSQVCIGRQWHLHTCVKPCTVSKILSLASSDIPASASQRPLHPHLPSTSGSTAQFPYPWQ